MKNTLNKVISRLKTAQKYNSEIGLQKYNETEGGKAGVGGGVPNKTPKNCEAISNDLTYLYWVFQHPE